MMNAIITFLAACLLHVVCGVPTSVCDATWPTIAEKYCNGTQQSPINIVTTNVQANANLTSLTFTGYNDKAALTLIKNTGTTIQVTLDHEKMHVQGGDLPGLFASTEFHLHWGNGSTTPGSEHGVNGKRFPMELHIVNKAERNATVSGNSALAVLGFFIEASNDTGKPESWKTLTSYLAKIANAGDQEPIYHISMDDLLTGVDRSKYYRYLGSLTTPNCNEGVIWTIFQDPIKVSWDLIDLFTTSVYINKTTNSPLMTNTFRGVQPINGRVVMSQVAGTKTTRLIKPTSSTKTTGLLDVKTTGLIKPTSSVKTTGLIKPTSSTKTTGLVGTKSTSLIKPTSGTNTSGLLTPTSGIKTTSLIKPTSAATNLSQALILPLLSVVLLYCILPLL